MKIKDTRSLPPIAQEDLRRKAIQAIADGMTQEEAGKLFGVSRQAVNKWVKRYREGGKRALRAGRRGRPKQGALESWQAAQIVRAIEDRCPDQLKLPFFLWTREAVGALIAQRFKIRLSVWTVGTDVAETGVASGVSSSYFLCALAANGGGRLHSIDFPTWEPDTGWIVPDNLKDRWELIVGRSS